MRERRRPVRTCSKVGCHESAEATLTYVYADSTAVLGPLSSTLDPHGYDLCELHAGRLTAPLGWQVVRIEPDPESLRPSGDDLEALANAVREAAAASERSATLFDELESRTAVGAEGTRRGHLRSLPAGYDSEG